jgi:hypothetical protein
MAVIKFQLDGIIANWFDSGQFHIDFAGLQDCVIATVPPDFGGGREYPQVFSAQSMASQITVLQFQGG